MEKRARYVKDVTRVVVKVGTGVLSDSVGRLDESLVRSLAGQIARLSDGGRQIVLVSSGAIGAGVSALGLPGRPKTLPELQAAASVGQSKLIGFYDQCLAPLGYHAAQILLTRADFDCRDRYLNACNTINALFNLKAVPIINENDAISVDEIKFGDNDILSAFVTNMIRADLLILLTSADGLYRNAKSKEVIHWVEKLDDEVLGFADRTKTKMGSGGMTSKLQAVQVVVNAGEPVVIANGKAEDILVRIMAGERVGTLFSPGEKALGSYKRWIGFTARPRGRIVVDKGAEQALRSKSVSLLPVGIVDAQGEFAEGDVVAIFSADGEEIARGLTNYSSADLQRIKGLRSTQIKSTLGYKYYDEVIHYDNMVVWGRT